MRKRQLSRFVLITLITLILMSAVNEVAAGNTVPPTRLDDLTPAACATIPGLTNVVTGSGLIFGTAGPGTMFSINVKRRINNNNFRSIHFGSYYFSSHS